MLIFCGSKRGTSTMPARKLPGSGTKPERLEQGMSHRSAISISVGRGRCAASTPSHTQSPLTVPPSSAKSSRLPWGWSPGCDVSAASPSPWARGAAPVRSDGLLSFLPAGTPQVSPAPALRPSPPPRACGGHFPNNGFRPDPARPPPSASSPESLAVSSSGFERGDQRIKN